MLPIEYIKLSESKIDKTLGYKYFCDCQHPLASKGGKVYEHRHEASIKLGRWILEHEVVHHIDHNRTNNSHENLEVLSSHSEHNKLHMVEKYGYTKTEKECPVCNKVFLSAGKVCCSVLCAIKKRNPPLAKMGPEDLREMIWAIPTVKIAELYHVSDTAISKKCKKWGIKKPSRGYWEKIYHKQENK